MPDRVLIKNGYVVTMDDELADIPNGDVLIEGNRIVQVGREIAAADAEVVDATGKVVLPGFIDTHRHTWETAIRGCAPDATLEDYFVEVLDTFAPLYRPEDVYASNLAGALECLNAGITTLVDWSHINNTPEHPDAAIQGLKDAGIRAIYAYGPPNTSLQACWFNSTIVMPREDIERVRKTYFNSDDGLITMAMATRGPGFCTDDVVRQEWAIARDLGLQITIHVGMGRLAGRWQMVEWLERLGLLYPDTTYIHCCHFTDREWQLVADSRGKISIAPQVEMQMGHGWPPFLKAMRYGLRPSLSIDVVTTVPGDMFTQMRCAFACERARLHEAAWDQPEPVRKDALTARDILKMATINGAHVILKEDQLGSLTPGKKADVVVIDTTAVNLAPLIDAVAAVVVGADVSNVETVLVDGRFVKRDGKLLADWERARRLVEASRDYLLEARERKLAQQAQG
ncbi:MAG: amidohydrolase family protein [Thermomicrobium sp.]|nr:amidohydrolase family protein [Thermomicrobium sp.]